MIPENYQKLVRTSLFAIVSASFVFSCSAPPPKKAQQQPDVVEVEQPQILTAQDYVVQSKTQDTPQAIDSLLTASQLYLTEQNYNKALWLANQIQPLVTNAKDKYQARIVKATALLALAYPQKAKEQLALADELSVKHSLEYYQLLSDAQLTTGFPVQSLIANLQAFPLNSEANEQDINAIWQAFIALSPQQVAAISAQGIPHAKGWLQLTRYANRFGANSPQFSRYLSQWSQQYPTHPANMVVAQLQESLANAEIDNSGTLTNAKTNIAVILPLTGKQQAAGNAAQQGILAAYANNNTNKLHFIDAEQLEWQNLPELLAAQNVDFVIGPLLRENVQKFQSVDELDIPALFLNVPAQLPLAPHHYAISMRPEDEAIQAANILSNKQYKMPLVLAYQDAVSQRIANAFVNEWQRVTGYQPKTMAFTKGKKMQTMLKSALGVEQSQARINDLNRRIKHTIKADTRNRRDIDMIYIVGTPTQTRLLKPYIDVNISPFADTIPIYASSRSHSAKIDDGDTRDLAGLSFSEMPWLLSSKQQNKPLAQTTKQLFPNRSDSLQRIFAMGYDALGLVNKVEVMAQRPYARHFGQIGTLTLNEQHILTRSLIWGRYFKDRVTEIAMD